jgi:hypothetical protein
MLNFQRNGSISNTHVGLDFEKVAIEYFQSQGLHLQKKLILPIGIGQKKKNHSFDLGNSEQKVIVECKSHKWTEGDNVPSAKMTVWNEAMYYFYCCPVEYRKIMFILKDYSVKRKQTLAEYYVRTYSHLIPENVELLEYDYQKSEALWMTHR